MGLTLIYHFHSSENKDGNWLPARYRVTYFFSGTGLLKLTFLRELSKSVPDADHENLTFLNLDDLKAFALRVCQELKEEQVRLISVQDYNIGVDGARDLESFQEVFRKFGEVVVNEEVVRKKGILSKLFS